MKGLDVDEESPENMKQRLLLKARSPCPDRQRDSEQAGTIKDKNYPVAVAIFQNPVTGGSQASLCVSPCSCSAFVEVFLGPLDSCVGPCFLYINSSACPACPRPLKTDARSTTAKNNGPPSSGPLSPSLLLLPGRRCFSMLARFRRQCFRRSPALGVSELERRSAGPSKR